MWCRVAKKKKNTTKMPPHNRALDLTTRRSKCLSVRCEQKIKNHTSKQKQTTASQKKYWPSPKNHKNKKYSKKKKIFEKIFEFRKYSIIFEKVFEFGKSIRINALLIDYNRLQSKSVTLVKVEIVGTKKGSHPSGCPLVQPVQPSSSRLKSPSQASKQGARPQG